MTTAAFVSVILIHLLAAMSPGPSFVVCLRIAVTRGFRTAVGLAVGFGLGAALWAVAALAGLALLFELVPGLFLALKIVGGAFLMWIAVQMWRHATEPLDLEASTQEAMTFARALRFGLLTFASNPKTAVFFGAVFVGLVPAGTPLATLALLVTAIFINETLWYIVVARLFSLPQPRRAYVRAKAWTDRAFGSFLGLFGLKIALT
ncbi:threonine transporter [Primorskyibacter flagellatus]|uniref:Threonine transporter n=1 Tax=Primorskyibacter flagellatus TaxID=1387277 RepID=A0A917EEA5_9RHOB|nr:LysE family transporter [Primorskyibacter flagellatus]GGE23448.1 threonine transporter [Primorskyibacter flagellatus]